MKTQRNWIKVTVFVVLALASLSSIAMSAPPRAPRTVYITPLEDVCGEVEVDSFDQYLAAIEWAEKGGTELPFTLTVSCEEESPIVSSVDLGGESVERFEQYMAALDPSFGATWLNRTRFEQYMEAIESSASVEPVPNPEPIRIEDDAVERFEQYMAALDPSFGATWLNATRVEQYLAAIEESVASVEPLDIDDDGVERFEQYMAALDPSFGATWHNLTRAEQYAAALDPSFGATWLNLTRAEQYGAALDPSFGATWLNVTRVEQYLAAIE